MRGKIVLSDKGGKLGNVSQVPQNQIGSWKMSRSPVQKYLFSVTLPFFACYSFCYLTPLVLLTPQCFLTPTPLQSGYWEILTLERSFLGSLLQSCLLLHPPDLCPGPLGGNQSLSLFLLEACSPTLDPVFWLSSAWDKPSFSFRLRLELLWDNTGKEGRGFGALHGLNS